MFQKRVLIISYVFPPNQGIGGRRWAKFAKYLTREGYDVHVIYANGNPNEQSPWWNDVEGNKHILLHPVKSWYPASFTHPPRHLPDKIIYKLWYLFLGIFFKGYIYDRTIFSGKRFVQEADKVIKQFSIGNVIVTGAPFRLVYLIAKAKRNWQHIRMIADFRDPWTWETGGDYQKLPSKSLLHEMERERFVVEQADYITVPTRNMMNFLKEKYKIFASKMALLPHAWDEDEIRNERKAGGAVTRLILFGTLYHGIEREMEFLAIALKSMKGKVHLDIYSDSRKYIDIFFKCGAESSVTYFPVVPSSKLYKCMNKYAASVIINNYSDKDHVSTKFIELAASGTPVIYIAPEGKAADFVTNNKTGWHVQPEQLPQLFRSMVSPGFHSPAIKLNITDLTFRNVTKLLIQFLNIEKPKEALELAD